MDNTLSLIHDLDYERLTGSEGEKKAANLIINFLEEQGLTPKKETFSANLFTPGSAVLTIDGKEFTGNPYGVQEEKEVSGELVFLENADVLTYNRNRYKNKIVLAYTAGKRVSSLLAETPVKGFIQISPPHKDAVCTSHRQKLYEEKKTVPSMTITYAKAEELIGLSGTKCTLTIKQKTGKGEGTNIVVSVGNKKIDETVTYLVGHYDSVAWSHGSVDNAGGTVCLLKAAEYFAKNQPERELKIIFFSGEELGLLGSSAYVKKHKKEVKNRAALVVNVDVSGEIIGDDVFTVTGTKQLLGYAAGIAREEGLMFKERLSIYSSDSIPFAVKEVPSVNIYRSSGKAAFYIHTKDDVGKNVSPEGLQNSYQAAQALLNRVLGSKIYPVRREIDDSLRENLEKYLWNLYLEKPSLEWKPKYKR